MAHYLQGLPSCYTEAKDPVPVPHVLHQSKIEEKKKKLNAVRIMMIIIYRYQVLLL